jgi:hypothetical protein
MDQTLAIIFASGITGIFTLGAAIIVPIMTNRQTVKLEQLRVKEVERTEKAKRKTELIEEVYQILIITDDMLDAFEYEVIHGSGHPGEGVDVVGNIKEIRKTSDRLKVLLPLHMPSLKEDFEMYNDHLVTYWNVIERTYSPGLRSEGDVEKKSEAIQAVKTNYKESLSVLQTKLEEMAN